MDIRQLRYFAATLDAGSLTAAARSINISQPALGEQISKLECELGTRLFIRHARGVSPTEAGELLRSHATLLLRQLDQATEDIRALSGPPRGSAALGVTPTAGLNLIAPLIERCRDSLPHVSLRILEGLSEANMAWLTQGRLDLALTYNIDDEGDMDITPVLEEELFLVGPGDDRNRRLRRKTVAFRHIVELPLILPSQPHGLRQALNTAAAANDLTLEASCEFNALAPKKDMVERGGGYTVVPYGAVYREVHEGRLRARRIVDPVLPRTLYAARSRARPQSNAVDAVLRELCAMVNGMIGKSGPFETGYRVPARAQGA